MSIIHFQPDKGIRDYISKIKQNPNIEFECKHNYFYKQDLNQKFDGRKFSLSWETV